MAYPLLVSPSETSIAADRVISMTELQKLSLRKLREMRLDEVPLVVRDLKRRQGRFVILDHDAYERLVGSAPAPADAAPRLEDVPFAEHGLLWDRPTMTDERFAAILGDPADPDHRWAWSRALERLPSRVVTSAVGLAELRARVAAARLRPVTRRAWESRP
jgi:hypothetical protein